MRRAADNLLTLAVIVIVSGLWWIGLCQDDAAKPNAGGLLMDNEPPTAGENLGMAILLASFALGFWLWMR